MHEKAPLFQIYTFIQSRKYFDRLCAEAASKQRDTLVEQSRKVFKSLAKNKKLAVSAEKITSVSELFVSGFLSELDAFLLEKKRALPECSFPVKEELNFAPSEEKDFEKAVRFVESFVSVF